MPNYTVDLSNCDREPIHVPGSIQPHGALLAFDAGLNKLSHYSENLQAILGTGHADMRPGMTSTDLLGEETTHALRNGLANSYHTGRPSQLFSIAIAGHHFDLAVHRSGDDAIVEIEPVRAGAGQPLDIVRNVISRIGRATTIESLTKEAARLIRATLGYDRVMVYRFEEDGAGQVISEAKNASLESFLGQYFPASDIPQQARRLYLKNTIRIISDAGGARVAILPAVEDGPAPLDLSHAHLRSVSPIHCEYLRNMGVGASMSISIIIDGTLWGLIACHHYSPKILNMAERVAAEMFGEFFSLHLDVIRQKTKIDSAAAARSALDSFLQEAPLRSDAIGLLRETLPKFYQMLPSDGVGLWINGRWTTYGTTPPADAIEALAQYAQSQSEARLWSTHSLCKEFAEAQPYCADASGVLVIPLSQRSRDYLFFFRKEFEHTLNWAGNPEKSYESGPLGDRLTPRKSFDIWKETVKGQSRRWTDADLQTGEAIRSALVEVVLRHNELIVEERGKADLRQRMLNEELNHRVKNILAVIKSLVGRPNPPGRTLDEYLAILRGRIEALAIAHDQIVRGEGGGFLKDLLSAELKPYRDQSAEIVLEGPAVWIDTTAFSVLALVFHELSTNAAKYGALSCADGRLAVSWSIDEARTACSIVWKEEGGPPVRTPERKGFGSILIARSIPHDLGGESSLDYRREGLVAHFVIPSKHIAVADAGHGTADGPEASQNKDSGRARAMEDITLLLVEDQMLIAMDAEMMLSEYGLTNVVTVSSASEALKKLKTYTPMAAVLDVNLGAVTSLPIAEELRRQGVPFIFATGYGDGSIIPEEFSDIQVVRKPYSGKELMPAILNLLEH